MLLQKTKQMAINLMKTGSLDSFFTLMFKIEKRHNYVFFSVGDFFKVNSSFKINYMTIDKTSIEV